MVLVQSSTSVRFQRRGGSLERGFVGLTVEPYCVQPLVVQPRRHGRQVADSTRHRPCRGGTDADAHSAPVRAGRAR
jgi:hypothetical protein